MKINKVLMAVASFLLLGACSESSNRIGAKVYAMDCGKIEVSDMKTLDVNGSMDGKPYTLIVPCFLVRHPKGDLLWDTGWPQELMAETDGMDMGDSVAYVEQDLLAQLEQLQIKPQDIEYLSLSHSHPDHSGNAGLFSQSTFIVNRLEREAMFSEHEKSGAPLPAYFAKLADAKTVRFESMYDVFGDGTVTIHHMPGHTSGHSVLLVKPKTSQPLLFSGDLYVFEQARKRQLIPSPLLTYDAKLTKQSMKDFETLAEVHNAKVVIQHEPEHFNALPKFPAALE